MAAHSFEYGGRSSLSATAVVVQQRQVRVSRPEVTPLRPRVAEARILPSGKPMPADNCAFPDSDAAMNTTALQADAPYSVPRRTAFGPSASRPMTVSQPGNRPLPGEDRSRVPASSVAEATGLQMLDALRHDLSAAGQQRTLAAAAMLLMDPTASLHPTLQDMLEDCISQRLHQQGAAHDASFGPDSLEAALETLSPSQRRALWAAVPASADEPLRALWQYGCLHAQGLLIQQARERLQQVDLSPQARARLRALIPDNAGTDGDVALRTADAETALRDLDRQCAPARQSLLELDRQLHWREWTQALPSTLAAQAVSHALLYLLPSTRMFRAVMALPGLCREPPGTSTIAAMVAAVTDATSPSEALAAINAGLEKGLLTPALLLQVVAAAAVSPVGAAVMLVIGAVVCGVQDGVTMRLLQRTGVPRSELGKCVIESQRMQANGTSAWTMMQALTGSCRTVMATGFEDAGDVDAARAQVDAIDDIHRLFQGSLHDEERVAALRQRHQHDLHAIGVSLQDAQDGVAGVLRQERARLEQGLSLLQDLPVAADERVRVLEALHDVRGTLLAMPSAGGRGAWPGWLVKWLPACLVGVRNVLPHTLQDTVASPFISSATAADTTATTMSLAAPGAACGAIRRNPIIAVAATATAIITTLMGTTLISRAYRSSAEGGGGAQDTQDATGALMQARASGPYSPEGQFADGSSPLCIGIYLHDDLLPTDTRLEEIHQKYFSWLLRELKTVFPGKHIYFHYMKHVPGITDMSYRTWFDEMRSLQTFTLKAVEHGMGGAIPYSYVHKYLLMTDSGPSLRADGVAGRYSAIASNNRYSIPAHEIGHMLDAEHEHSRVHYYGWWCGTLMNSSMAAFFRTSCYFFSEENRQRMREHQGEWRNSPLL